MIVNFWPSLYFSPIVERKIDATNSNMPLLLLDYLVIIVCLSFMFYDVFKHLAVLVRVSTKLCKLYSDLAGM